MRAIQDERLLQAIPMARRHSPTRVDAAPTRLVLWGAAAAVGRVRVARAERLTRGTLEAMDVASVHVGGTDELARVIGEMKTHCVTQTIQKKRTPQRAVLCGG